MLDWDDLQIFHAAAKHGSLNRAANVLDVHRSTILRRIERLEAEIGQKVLDRGPEGVLLTAAGERLLEHTERIADETHELVRTSDDESGRPTGIIQVDATFNLAFGLLPGLLAGFRDKYPEIAIDLVATPDGYSPLRADDTDVGFRTLERGTKGHEEMVGRRLGQLPVAVYGAQSYLDAAPPIQTAADLPGHRLILGSENLAHIAAVQWLKDAYKPSIPLYRASSMPLMLSAVRDGIGLACVPHYLGDRENELVRVLEMDASLATKLWVLRHPRHRDTARMRAFSEFVSNCIPDLL